jgi:hypothetical protein
MDTKYKIKTISGEIYNLPIFLNSEVYEMGNMVSFSGEIEQIEQLCNFTYTQSGLTLTLTLTVNPDKHRKIVEQQFTIKWGDGYESDITISTGTTLSSQTYTYIDSGTYNVELILSTPWQYKKITKKITLPSNVMIDNELGTFTGITIPSTGNYLNYLNDYDYTDNDGDNELYFIGIGQSRIDELKKYGETTYNGTIIGVDTSNSELNGLEYIEYEIDNLTYRDYENGFTTIFGHTSNFEKEEVFNKMLTRNEHFLGFIDNPKIYSDIFIERGKMSVSESNLRLGEIDNLGELSSYGNGYFEIKNQ